MLIVYKNVGLFRTIIGDNFDNVESTTIKINVSHRTNLLLVDNVFLKRYRNIAYNYTYNSDDHDNNVNLKLLHKNKVMLYEILLHQYFSLIYVF